MYFILVHLLLVCLVFSDEDVNSNSSYIGSLFNVKIRLPPKDMSEHRLHRISSQTYDYSLLCAEGIPLLMEDHRPRACHPKPWLEDQKCPRGFWCHHGEEVSTYYCCPESRKFRNYCHLPPATGFGQQSVRRFYYDWKTDGCHEVLYTGIGGNQNSFLTYEKCENSCRGAGEPPKALQNLVTYTKDKINKNGHKIEKGKKTEYDLTDKQKSSTSSNLYITETTKSFSKELNNKAVTLVAQTRTSKSTIKASTRRPSTPIPTTQTSSTRKVQTFVTTVSPASTSEPQNSENPCDQVPDPGRSGGIATQMWYYDSTGLSCVQFTYMGSGGNSNKFYTAKDCIRVCGIGKPSRKACELPPSIGSGPYKVPRYYFDKSTRQCELFHYSGENGNDNRFYKKHKCERLCLGKSQKKKEHSTNLPLPPHIQPTRPPERIVQNLVAAQTHAPIMHVYETLPKETTSVPNFLFTTEGNVPAVDTHPTLVYVSGEINPPTSTESSVILEPVDQQLPDIDNIFSSLMSGPIKPKNVLPSVNPVASTNVRSNTEIPIDLGNAPSIIPPSSYVSPINLPVKQNTKEVFEVPQIIESPMPPTPRVPIQVSVENVPYLGNTWSASNSAPGMLPLPENTLNNFNIASTPSSPVYPVTSPYVQVPKIVPVPAPPVIAPRVELISQPANLTFSSQPTIAHVLNPFVGPQSHIKLPAPNAQIEQSPYGPSAVQSSALEQSLQAIISQMELSRNSQPSVAVDPSNHASRAFTSSPEYATMTPLVNTPAPNVFSSIVSTTTNYAKVMPISSYVVAPVAPISYQTVNIPTPAPMEFRFNGSHYSNLQTPQTVPANIISPPQEIKNVLPQIIFMERASLPSWGTPEQTVSAADKRQPIPLVAPTIVNVSDIFGTRETYGVVNSSPSNQELGGPLVNSFGNLPTEFSLPRILNLTYGVSSNVNSPCRIPITGEPVILCENQPGVCPSGSFCQVGEGQSMCCPAPNENPCFQPISSGVGQSKLLRWSFDVSTSLCLPFVFQGFQGNQNNFLEYKECVLACHAKSVCSSGSEPILPIDSSQPCSVKNPCPENSMCHSDSSYGVCCSTPIRVPQISIENLAIDKDNTISEDPCKQGADGGFGLEAHQRWAFSASNNTCLPFLFKGKGGNNNNFITRDDCRAVCKVPDRMPAKCLEPPKSGDGFQYLTRYFYSPEYRQCLSFVYSGESGNGNNFETQVDCLETCVANGVKFSSLGTSSTYKFTFSEKSVCPQGKVLLDGNKSPVRCEASQNLHCPPEYICTSSGSESFCCPAPESFCLQSRPALSVCSGGAPVQEIRFTYDPLADKCIRFTYENCAGPALSLNNFNTQPQCMKLCCHQGFNLVYKRKLLKRMMNDDPLK